jgi:hypothetical protein
MILLAALAALWLATSACSCSGLLGNARPKPTARPTEVAIIRTAEPEAAAEPTSTPAPTASTAPTLAPELDPTSEPGILAGLPSEADQPFTLEFTEEKLNEYLAGQTYGAQGVTVKDITVVLTGEEILCTFHASELRTGLNAGITVHAVPVVVDGAVYVQVDEVILDDSVKGLARTLAKGAIEQAVKRYSTPQGIPVPIQGMDVEKVELMTGRMIVTGRTR